MALYRSIIIIIIIIISYLILNICFVFAYEAAADADSLQWCQKTPHPVQCNSLITLNPNPKPRTETQFVKLVVQLTIDRAMQSKRHAYSLGPKCRNNRERAAWKDCLELHDLTIHRLNQTTFLTGGFSDSDVQTWLSSALTSLDTCQLGFSDIGVSDDFLPSSFNNVSKLISNALAINKATTKPLGERRDAYTAEMKADTGRFLESPSSYRDIDVTVAKDGTGDVTTIEEAVNLAKLRKGHRRYVIHVKKGIYEEYIEIGPNLENIMMVGDGIGKTIITGDKSYGGGYSTFKSATFVAAGDGFAARDITFRNTAGPNNGQAVALRSDSDRSVFYKCSFEGYQDTLYLHSGRQFFRHCDIFGTVDFIFGNSAAVFHNCRILARYPPNRLNTITAQGRLNPNQTTGIVIYNSTVAAAPDLDLGSTPVETYLGRPWRPYARTVVMESYLGGLVNPSGWLKWGNDSVLETLYYGEYQNSGPGSSTKHRVKWPGFHVITNDDEATKFRSGNFIGGKSWLPADLFHRL